MFNKKILAASMAAAITTGGMVAQSHALEVTNNDVGQVLLGPVFFVENGYTTDITVTNTRTDAAVKAKIVFRSHVDTEEVLDFMLYLSPGDVWRGQVVTGEDGNGHIVSNDDSMRNALDDGWASDVDPETGETTGAVDQPFATPPLERDSNTFGHIEVIGFYVAAGTYSAGLIGTEADVTVVQGMSKDGLKSIFDSADRFGVADPVTIVGREFDYANCLPAEITPNTVSSISPCAMQLMGSVTIGNVDDPNRATMRMTALGTDVASIGIFPNDVEAEKTYVITNARFTANTSDITDIGVGFGADGGVIPTDNIAAIEMALAGTQTSYEYESNASENTHTLVTFPTRYRHKNLDTCTLAASDEDYTAPFNTDGSVRFKYASLDNSEKGVVIDGSSFSGFEDELVIASFPDEVNYHYKMLNFADSGWAFYNWQNRPTSCYRGVPVIAYSYKFITEDNASVQTMLQKAPNTQ